MMDSKEGIVKQSEYINDLYITRVYNPDNFSQYIYQISIDRDDRGMSVVDTYYCYTKLKNITPVFKRIERQFLELNK